MLQKLRKHIANHQGDANVSRMTMIAIVFVVGALLLVMTTSAFRNPVNRWFKTVTNDWFDGENGMFDLGIKPVCYINNKEWTFEEGMTWEEWSKSEYGDANYQYSTRVGGELHQVSLLDYNLSTQGKGTYTLAYKDDTGIWRRVYTGDTINPNLEYSFVPLTQSKYPE